MLSPRGGFGELEEEMSTAERVTQGKVDPSVAAVVAVLRIFAARGRAIREAAEKQENPGASQSDCGGSGSLDSPQPPETDVTAREEIATRSKGKAPKEVPPQTAKAEDQPKASDT